MFGIKTRSQLLKKVIEERDMWDNCLTAAQLSMIAYKGESAAVKAAKAVRYEGAGTIEFLVDKHKKFYSSGLYISNNT